MSHLAADMLWSFARQELTAQEQRQAQGHLDGCAECRASLADVTMATGLLAVLPEAPPMPEAMARRVGQSLADAADAKAAARFTSWWQSLFTPRFVFAAAMGVMLVTVGAWWAAGSNDVEVPAQPQLALPTPVPEVTQPTLTPAPTVKKLSVTVASAKKSTTQKAQVLAEGSTISTQPGGSVWLKLPDGSRAGLTSSSEVTLATLEEKTLTLDIAKGSLAMVVPHREDRLLTVRAGEIEVRDLGTRFLVSREANRTLVAVEEGVVSVKTPTGEREVRAGNAVSWSNGTLTELAWEPPQTAVAPVVQAPTPEKESVARLGDDEEDEDDNPPPPEEAREVATPDTTPVGADEDWATPPPPNTNQPVRAAPPPRVPSERGFSLKKIERKVRELGSRLTSGSTREAQAKNIAVSAEAGDCKYALDQIDRWLKAPITKLANEPQLRRAVKTQQIRCLNRLGRSEEASALERQLDPLP